MPNFIANDTYSESPLQRMGRLSEISLLNRSPSFCTSTYRESVTSTHGESLSRNHAAQIKRLGMGKYTPINTPYDEFTIARQPIFNKTNEVWGFELLYRAASDHKEAQITDPDLASTLISTCGFMQQASRSNSSRKVSINFTEELIIQLAPQALPPEHCCRSIGIGFAQRRGEELDSLLETRWIPHRY